MCSKLEQPIARLTRPISSTLAAPAHLIVLSLLLKEVVASSCTCKSDLFYAGNDKIEKVRNKEG